jgi:YVTN family beta-propeller protein
MQLRIPLSLVVLSLSIVAGAQHTGTLLVIQKGDQSLALVDPTTAKVIASVPEGSYTGHEVTASSDGHRAFVPIYGDSGVGQPGTNGTQMVVIDIASQKVIGNVDFHHGVRPHLPVIGPKDGRLYVTTELDKTITIIDPKSLKIIGTIPTGQPESHMLALSRDGLWGYTANVGPGTVSVLDIKERKNIAVIPVATHTQRISISNDDRFVFTSDTTKPQLVVIDTSNNQVKTHIDMPGTGYGSASTPDGNYLLIALPHVNKMGVIDLKTMTVARSIDVPESPQEVLVRPDGKVAYVSCMGSDQVAEVDLADWKVTRLIKTGKLTDGLAWAAGK